MLNEEIVTIQGIRELKKMDREKWPSNWIELIEGYIETKRNMILTKKDKDIDTSYDEQLLQEAIEFYLENRFKPEMKPDPSESSKVMVNPKSSPKEPIIHSDNTHESPKIKKFSSDCPKKKGSSDVVVETEEEIKNWKQI
jgi:hypothetical protein